MKNRSFSLFFGLIVFLVYMSACIQMDQFNEKNTSPPERHYKTYCNPIDIDYSYMSHNRVRANVSYRSGADPAVVNFKGKFYLFVTRSHGYWTSDDMSNWKFIRPQSWYFNGCNAPAAAVKDGKIMERIHSVKPTQKLVISTLT